MTDHRYQAGQHTQITNGHIPLLVSSVHLYANNTIITLVQQKIVSQNLFKCSVGNND